MNVAGAMEEALRRGPGAVAIACADVHAGLLLGASACGDAEHDAVVDAATSASQVCALPQLDGEGEVEEVSDETLVVSTRWVHAYARVAQRPDLVVVGVAPGGTNVGLLLAWVKEVAGGLGAAA